ncbi:Hypothetical predicted protein [Lecanosticta acicola]|uniref:Uncharacterized protein n=1 Tax=Lecanosticta acicola TaxID=111012 RepID=A0AAI9EEC0_9PEZI|nr:Hypothetical predicted protein [Lecanosticta acicola]
MAAQGSSVLQYGTENRTGAQLLERRADNYPRYALKLSAAQKDTLTRFCQEHHLGGTHALPTTTQLLALAQNLQLLPQNERADVIKEVLRRIAKKVEAGEGLVDKKGKNRIVGSFWDTATDGPVGDLVDRAVDEWTIAVAQVREPQQKQPQIEKKKPTKSSTISKPKDGSGVLLKTEPQPPQQQQPMQTVPTFASSTDARRHVEELVGKYQVLDQAEKDLIEQLRKLEMS